MGAYPPFLLTSSLKISFPPYATARTSRILPRSPSVNTVVWEISPGWRSLQGQGSAGIFMCSFFLPAPRATHHRPSSLATSSVLSISLFPSLSWLNSSPAVLPECHVHVRIRVTAMYLLKSTSFCFPALCTLRCTLLCKRCSVNIHVLSLASCCLDCHVTRPGQPEPCPYGYNYSGDLVLTMLSRDTRWYGCYAFVRVVRGICPAQGTAGCRPRPCIHVYTLIHIAEYLSR